MGIEERVLGRIELAIKHAKGMDPEILSRKPDTEALKRALADKETADFLKICFGLIERSHHSKETTIRLINSAISLLGKMANGGSRFETREERKGYYRINNELLDFREGTSRLDKRQASSLKEYKKTTCITLERMIQVLESLLKTESIPEDTRAELGSLSIALAALKALLEK